MIQSTDDLILKIDNEYYTKAEDLVKNVKIYDFNSYQDFNAKVSSVYLNTCHKLLAITRINKDFTFEDYVVKRAFLKKHNDSILDEIYLQYVQLFS